MAAFRDFIQDIEISYIQNMGILYLMMYIFMVTGGLCFMASLTIVTGLMPIPIFNTVIHFILIVDLILAPIIMTLLIINFLILALEMYMATYGKKSNMDNSYICKFIYFFKKANVFCFELIMQPVLFFLPEKMQKQTKTYIELLYAVL